MEIRREALTGECPLMLQVAVTVYVPFGHQGVAPVSRPHWTTNAGLVAVAVPRLSDPCPGAEIVHVAPASVSTKTTK
jgi:hypothetical protein